MATTKVVGLFEDTAGAASNASDSVIFATNGGDIVTDGAPGDIVYDTSVGALKMKATGGEWLNAKDVSASNGIGFYDSSTGEGDITIDPANGRLWLPNEDKIEYGEPDEFAVGDLVRMRDPDNMYGKTFGVVESISPPYTDGDPDQVYVRWEHHDFSWNPPPVPTTHSDLGRQRDTSLMYDLMQKKISDGKRDFKQGDAVHDPNYPGSFGIIVDDPRYSGPSVNVDWKENTMMGGVTPPMYTNIDQIELAPMGQVLEDQMEKIRQDQGAKFQDQEQKLYQQETQLASLEEDRAQLRHRLNVTQSETETLKTRFEMAIKRIEQLEGAGLVEEAREVERNECLPVLASMSKKQRIKTLALAIASVVGKQVVGRLANQSGLTNFIVHLLMGNG